MTPSPISATMSSVPGEDSFWERIYGGEIVRFEGNPVMRLVRHARKLARKTFGTDNPRKAHLLHKRQEMFRLCDQAQEEFSADPAIKRLAADALGDLGLDVNGLYMDIVMFRIAPPVETHGGGTRSHVGIHRDTWGVAVQQQANWWMPVWPVARKRTMAFYPDHWTRPISNNTDNWSVQAYLEARKNAPAGTAPSYPSAPLAQEMPMCEPHPVMLPPGDLLCFSSAHLHGSVSNTTSFTRFSLEWRTVRESDVRSGKGAPNVDCHTPKPVYRLFSRLTDKANLSEVLTAA